jgi:LysM repeat protein
MAVSGTPEQYASRVRTQGVGMPPETDVKERDERNDSRAPKDEDGNRQPVRNADDIVRNSLERQNGGSGGGDAPTLSDSLLRPPKGNFTWNARGTAIEANLAEGKVTVSNMSYTVRDADGGTREISGPTSYNARGQQFIIDADTKQRFRVVPPTEDGGSATLRPISRRNNAEPLQVVSQQNVELLSIPLRPRNGDGNGNGNGTGTREQPRGEGTQPRDGQTTGTTTGVVREVTPGTQPATGQPKEQPTTPAVQPTPGKDTPVVPTQPAAGDQTTPQVVPTNRGGDVVAGNTPVAAVDRNTPVPAVDRNQPVVPTDRNPGNGNGQGNGDGNGNGNGRSRRDGDGDGNSTGRRHGDFNPSAEWLARKGFSEQQIQQIREVVRNATPEQLQQIRQEFRDNFGRRGNGDQQQYQAQPPATPERVEQWRQNPQQWIDTLRQRQLEQIGFKPEHQPGQQTGRPQEQPVRPQDVIQPVRPQDQQRPGIDPSTGRPVDQHTGRNPLEIPTDRGRITITPEQAQQLALAQIQQALERNRGDQRQAQHTPTPGEGQTGQIDPRRMQQIQAEMDLRGRVLEHLPKPQHIDQQLADMLRDKNNRPAMLDLLKELQQGKLPNEQQLQNNKQMADLVKAIGPEALQDLRRLLMLDKDGNPLGHKPGDTKFDTALSPKAREIIELMAQQLTPRTRDGDGQRLMNPGTLASERLLDILRQTDKLNQQPRVPDADATKANMLELGRVLRELNVQNQDGKPLTMRDLIARTMEDGVVRDRAQLPTGERRDMVIRPNGPEDLVVKNLLDRVMQTREGDAKHDLTTRTTTTAEALAARLDPRAEGKLDIRIEKPDPSKIDATIKPEMAVRPEDMIRGQKDLTAKTDATLQPGQRVVDPNDLQQQNKNEQVKHGQSPDAQAKQEEELKNRKDVKQKKEDDEELPVDNAAMLAALQAKKRKEQEEKDKQEGTQEKDKKEPERRTKYIVRAGDTLESIALKQLRNKQLAGLIFDINKEVINVHVVAGKKVPVLEEKMIIWLPTATECKEYRTRLMTSTPAGQKSEFASAEDELVARFGKNWDGPGGGAAPATTAGGALEDMEDAARAAYAARRKHIESLLGPLSSKSKNVAAKHVVRLGETLKSVAMKHPALQDVSLWKLLAEVNGLPTDTDDKGNPLARLSRGQALMLPSSAEVAAYRQRESSPVPKEKITGAIDLPTRSCPSCQRTTFASAVLCPGCGAGFEEKAVAPALAKVAPAPEPSTRIIDTPDDRSPGTPEYTLFNQFSESARLMKAGTMDELQSGYKLQLEILENSAWMPIVGYEVFSGVCLRHEFVANGQRKTIRIDLPPQAALELANNDLQSNWKSYEAAHRGSNRA